ncbi:hypothetical protein Tco_1189604 [Tanacetum coccineum]
MFPQLDSGLAVPSFLPSDDPIATLTKQWHSSALHFPHGRQNQSYAGSEAKGNATGLGGNKIMGTIATNQTKVIRCYNCRGEGYMIQETVDSGPDTQTLPTTTIFQTDDLDAFNSNVMKLHWQVQFLWQNSQLMIQMFFLSVRES